MNAWSRPLSPRAARTLYNVADALAGRCLERDLAPAVERSLRHAGPGAARRTWLVLALIEWQPRWSLRSRRGFSRQPRPVRRELLGRWEESRLAVRRAAFRELCDRIERAGDHSSGP